MNALPAHGTRKRFAAPWSCRCVACVKRKTVDPTYQPRWPLKYLSEAIGSQLEFWYSEEDLASWHKDGLSDVEADRVAIKLGKMPSDIWPGYVSAGLDFYGGNV